ncbi:MAG: hypothetical protein LC117_01055 [Bacteroidia bacterium]|nr:hypothetical protein [Bacteroidia bacterium]MCZ2276506.1 hypothetical protein [Bacteroidia bacterium]
MTTQTVTTEKQATIFPVIKLDYNFRMIDSNEAGKPLLCSWNCSVNSKIPISILERYPEIHTAIKENTMPDISIEMDGTAIKCTVVPFPEANYIGIYAYMIEYTEKTKEKVTLTKLN